MVGDSGSCGKEAYSSDGGGRGGGGGILVAGGGSCLFSFFMRLEQT